MAIRKDLQFKPNGFDTVATLSGAYFRVDSVAGDKTLLSATVVAYNDKAEGRVPAQVKVHKFAPVVGNRAKDFIAQAYDHIKTLPEYAGAEDC